MATDRDNLFGLCIKSLGRYLRIDSISGTPVPMMIQERAEMPPTTSSALPQTHHPHHPPTSIFCAIFFIALFAACMYLTLVLIRKLSHLRNDWGYWTALDDEEKGFEYSEEVRRAVEKRRGLRSEIGEGSGEEVEEEDKRRERLTRVADRVRAGYDGFRGN